jgi:cytochrome c-type biogenesis protein
MTLLDGNTINVGVAFLAGFVTFFASCLLPLVPPYLAYLSGVSLGSAEAGESFYRRRVVVSALLFVGGFILTFTVLGITASAIGQALASYRSLGLKLGGITMIVLGISMLGIVPFQLLHREVRITLPDAIKDWHILGSILVGMVFAFAWTPCIGPVLAVALYYAGGQENLWQGAALLLSFGIGLGLPFVIVALFFDKVWPFFQKYKYIGRLFQILAGLIILASGILLLMGDFQSLTVRIFQFTGLQRLL